MHKLTQQGQQVVNEIAMRYGLSSQAVELMLDAVANGGGTMAQFNIAELGGGGQWMQGGMTMVGDMFNHGLKMTVDNLCAELSTLYFNQPFKPQPQAQTGGQHGNVSLFVPGSGQSNWWPQELGQPSSSASQNNMRYAYFPNVNRLAIDAGGVIAIYDTLNHQIGGFSQQQSYDGSITLSSQFGVIQLSSLPRVDNNNPLAPAPQSAPQPEPAAPVSQPAYTVEATAPHVLSPAVEPLAMEQPQPVTTAKQSVSATGDVFEQIEKLGTLRDKGFVSEDEFNAKKAELLSRL
ncbi:SHOCT domain-containing protein [Cohaesibacter celericrescens]|jgi:hypothetical protein|uniref:SHOCT domain-containing protein n=1 Tax=Cohaesibacter celericrescens TaxID=2067669 RepID=A0A2N5XN20_9HYPH|nr:SHOCT domain-containing protein [Cohaesibacter celericrescens]PLW75929.1 hypothetical protein C0081_17665 [Cohaesibacter celericrescens]